MTPGAALQPSGDLEFVTEAIKNVFFEGTVEKVQRDRR